MVREGKRKKQREKEKQKQKHSDLIFKKYVHIDDVSEARFPIVLVETKKDKFEDYDCTPVFLSFIHSFLSFFLSFSFLFSSVVFSFFFSVWMPSLNSSVTRPSCG